MSKSSSEQIVDFLLDFLPNLLPKPLDSAATSIVETFRSQFDEFSHQPRLKKELLDAAQKSESAFRSEASKLLKNDDLVQAVASFPLFDNKLFQKTLAQLPEHLNENFLAQDLERIITDDWKGRFTPYEMREAISLYLNCLRLQLLKVDGFSELVTRLAILRTDIRTDRILDTVNELLREVSSLPKQSKSIQESESALFAIPNPVVDFTGREDELTKLQKIFLSDGVVIALSGGGGVGKTELAYKLASEIKDKYSDAQLEVNLQGTSENPLSSEDVMRVLLGRFYQKLPSGKEELADLYQQTFSTKKAIVLLDNAANARQVKSLILRPPVATAFIITSRQHFSLSEMGLLEPVRLDVLSREESRRFFRKIYIKGIDLPDADIDTLSELCGYLPLAIRVAASLLNVRSDWTFVNLLNRLTDERTRLERLSLDGDPDLDVNAILGLSYAMLDDETKKHFRALGVFPSKFKKYSLAAVCELNDVNKAEELIGYLLTRSLIVDARDPDSGIASYRMHDLTSLFAQNRLLEYPQEATQAILNHANYFLGLANMFDKEYRETGKDALTASRKNFEYMWAHLSEAWKRLSTVNQSKWARPDEADEWIAGFPSACPEMLLNHLASSEYIKILEESMDVAYKLNNKSLEITNLINLATLNNIQGDHEKALTLYKNALSLAVTNDDKKLVAMILKALADVYKQTGNTLDAIKCIDDAVLINEELDNVDELASNLIFIANTYFDSGDIEKAISTLELALEKVKNSKNKINDILILADLGVVYYSQKDIQKAIGYYEQALEISRKIENQEYQSKILVELMRLYLEAGRNMDAAVSFAKARTILRNANYPGASNIKSQVDGIRKDGDKLFQRMIRSSIIHDNDAPRLFELATKMSVSSTIPRETQELYKVLLKLLVGIKNPDLSNLQEPFAQMVKDELDSYMKSKDK